MQQHYKGYIGRTSFSEATGLYVGQVANCQTPIVYGSYSTQELGRLFQEAIEMYIRTCQQKGTEPEKPLAALLT